MATPTTIKDREEYAATRSPQDYVSPEVWDREVRLLMRDYPFDRVTAERMFGQAVSYLITSMGAGFVSPAGGSAAGRQPRWVDAMSWTRRESPCQR